MKNKFSINLNIHHIVYHRQLFGVMNLKTESDQNNIESLLRQVTLPSVFTFTELKSAIYSWANIKENQSHVIKLRRYDNSLVPLSALFQGSSKEKPFLMDVVKFHQFCTANIQSVSPDYTSIFKSKLEDLEKRISWSAGSRVLGSRAPVKCLIIISTGSSLLFALRCCIHKI
ncbi:uncharacterized protein LOC107982113 isoform X7 [Nasonia vitripennis]|uniref:Uncharacterized protein n=1 Tax=Nasonia vitripennis TaxID=7425 RepID=A0A7M7QMK8_NASVI|nr:uncharacterized protein LOC107982113 isoform X7 [Nasonia vitripennis]